MGGHFMNKTSKVAISLPTETLKAVERERAASGESRSQIIRRAIEVLLREKKEREKTENYIRGYREMPETKEEIDAARHSASVILAEEPW
jgi:metal-responsive CopG/Arc/MetJ family transcriptional regulator